jgi:dTDP-4-dehydrorhamnose reductase
MRILVTGSSGFLGGHLIEFLASQPNVDIFSLGRTCSSSLSGHIKQHFSLPPLTRRFSPAHGKRLLISLFQGYRFDAIVHCAAYSSLSGCEKFPTDAYIANVDYSRALMHYALETNTYLCGISTDLVFDGNKSPPKSGFNELDIPQPLSIYAKTKREMEEYFIGQKELSSMVLRTSLLYGTPRGQNGGPLQWILSSLREKRAIPAFVDEWRTPLFVTNLTEIIWRCLQHRHCGLLHCAGGTRCSREDFVRGIIRAAGGNEELISPCSRSTTPHPPARPEDVSLETKRLSQLLDFVPCELSEGLARVFP